MLSDYVILAGPVTYIGTWIIVILILLTCKISKEVTWCMLCYAALPIGAILTSGIGVVLRFVGM